MTLAYLIVAGILILTGILWGAFGQIAVHDAYLSEKPRVQKKVAMYSSCIILGGIIWPLAAPLAIIGWMVYGVTQTFKYVVKGEKE
jgi:hypothetical protein